MEKERTYRAHRIGLHVWWASHATVCGRKDVFLTVDDEVLFVVLLQLRGLTSNDACSRSSTVDDVPVKTGTPTAGSA